MAVKAVSKLKPWYFLANLLVNDKNHKWLDNVEELCTDLFIKAIFSFQKNFKMNVNIVETQTFNVSLIGE